MSKINRSTYQKVVEENKRLKNDIKILVNYEGDVMQWNEVMLKWYSFFTEEARRNNLIKEACKEYIKNHKDELPDFITDLI
jgi:hypothetical protein